MRAIVLPVILAVAASTVVPGRGPGASSREPEGAVAVYLYPEDRDRIAGAIREAEVSRGLADGCCEGLVAVHLDPETTGYLVGSLADSLGLRAYSRIYNRHSRGGHEGRPVARFSFCLSPAERRELVAALDRPAPWVGRELEVRLDREAAIRLLATTALALNAEIHPGH